MYTLTTVFKLFCQALIFQIEDPFHCPTKATTPSGSFEFPLKDNEYFHGNSAGLQYEAAGTRECLKNGKK